MKLTGESPALPPQAEAMLEICPHWTMMSVESSTSETTRHLSSETSHTMARDLVCDNQILRRLSKLILPLSILQVPLCMSIW